VNTSTFFSVADPGLIYGECFSDSSTPLVAPTVSTNIWDLYFAPTFSILRMSLEIFWLLVLAIFIGVIWYFFHKEPVFAGIGSFAFSLFWLILGLMVHILGLLIFSLGIVLLLCAGGITVWLVMKK
jgi:hypothetical protein